MVSLKRLGVIGCGGHARLSHLRFLDGAAVTAVCDPQLESLKKTFQIIGKDAAVCETPEELVGREDVDAVMIMTPDDTHPALLELAVAGGKHVLCEKPLAVTREGLATVNRALSEAEANGLLVASCHPRRNRHHADLPYGWINANLQQLGQELGGLKRIGLNSNYPRPATVWKHDRSFLLDKFVHDIDYLRFLLGDLPFLAERIFDSHDHYEVEGYITQPGRPVKFACLGMRLHGAAGEFVETITLNFEHGDCTVYTKTGQVRMFDRQTGRTQTNSISAMTPQGYDRVFSGLMRDFVAALNGGPRIHTFDDLRVVAESAVHLAEPRGIYSYRA